MQLLSVAAIQCCNLCELLHVASVWRHGHSAAKLTSFISSSDADASASSSLIQSGA